jgi:glycosyltransferase 2 family protein
VQSRTIAILKNVLKCTLGVVVLAYVIGANWEPKFQRNPEGEIVKEISPGIGKLLTQSPNYSYLALTGLLGAGIISCQIIRWYLLVRAVDLPFTIRNAFRLGMIGYFYNTLLPGSIGGDFLKAFFLTRDHPERKPTAVATVVADRFLGLFGLLLFASIIGGSYWFLGDARIAGNAYLTKIILVCGGISIAIVLGWVILGLIPPPRAERLLAGLEKWKWVGPILAELGSVVLLFRKRATTVYLTIPLTAFGQLMMIAFLHLAVRVFPGNDAATLGEHFVIGPVGFIGQAFFPAPGGVGGAEAIFGYLYTLIGRAEASGVVARLTMRVTEIGLGAIGYVVFLSMKKELPQAKEVASPVAVPS